MRVRPLLLTSVAFVLVSLGGGWALLGQGSDAGQRTVSEHVTPVPDAARTVTVSAAMPRPSASARRLSAMLEAGEMPRAPIPAEVVTDTDCAADERMVSHCRNEMRLADGRTIVLRHPHDMRSVPCLAPGERVLVVPST